MRPLGCVGWRQSRRERDAPRFEGPVISGESVLSQPGVCARLCVRGCVVMLLMKEVIVAVAKLSLSLSLSLLYSPSPLFLLLLLLLLLLLFWVCMYSSPFPLCSGPSTIQNVFGFLQDYVPQVHLFWLFLCQLTTDTETTAAFCSVDRPLNTWFSLLIYTVSCPDFCPVSCPCYSYTV